jgi:hypothetical protein
MGEDLACLGSFLQAGTPEHPDAPGHCRGLRSSVATRLHAAEITQRPLKSQGAFLSSV